MMKIGKGLSLILIITFLCQNVGFCLPEKDTTLRPALQTNSLSNEINNFLTEQEEGKISPIIEQIMSDIESTETLPYVVGVAGRAGVGKTEFLSPLIKRALEKKGKKVLLIGRDEFFKSSEERESLGEWDERHVRLQDAADFMAKVKKGEKLISRLKYVRRREEGNIVIPDTVNLEGIDVVIFDSIYAISSEERLGNILIFIDLPIYMEAKEKDLKKWRFLQETQKLHPRSLEKMEKHWQEGIVPDSERNIIPSRANADFIVHIGADHNISKIETLASIGTVVVEADGRDEAFIKEVLAEDFGLDEPINYLIEGIREGLGGLITALDKEDSEPLGYLLYRSNEDRGVYITRVFTRAKHRKEGIFTLLLEYCMDQFERIELNWEPDDELPEYNEIERKMRKWFEEHGFKNTHSDYFVWEKTQPALMETAREKAEQNLTFKPLDLKVEIVDSWDWEVPIPNPEEIKGQIENEIAGTELGRRFKKALTNLGINELTVYLGYLSLDRTIRSRGLLDWKEGKLGVTVGFEDKGFLKHLILRLARSRHNLKQGYHFILDEFYSQGILVFEDSDVSLSEPVEVPFDEILGRVALMLGYDSIKRLPSPGERRKVKAPAATLWKAIHAYSPGVGSGLISRPGVYESPNPYYLPGSRLLEERRSTKYESSSHLYVDISGWEPGTLTSMYSIIPKLNSIQDLKNALDTYYLLHETYRNKPYKAKASPHRSLKEANDLILKEIIRPKDLFPQEIGEILSNLEELEKTNSLTPEKIQEAAKEIFSKTLVFNEFVDRFIFEIVNKGLLDNRKPIVSSSPSPIKKIIGKMRSWLQIRPNSNL